MLVPALQTTQREKAAPFLCSAGSVPAGMQLACCNVPCFHSVPHREPKRFCHEFQQEQEQGQACFDTNRGQKPGQTQETISEHHKQSLPSSAEGEAHICPQNVWPVAGLQARSVDAGYRSLSLRGHLCHHALFSWMEQEVGAPLYRHCALHAKGDAHMLCPLPGPRWHSQQGICYLAMG